MNCFYIDLYIGELQTGLTAVFGGVYTSYFTGVPSRSTVSGFKFSKVEVLGPRSQRLFSLLAYELSPIAIGSVMRVDSY